MSFVKLIFILKNPIFQEKPENLAGKFKVWFFFRERAMRLLGLSCLTDLLQCLVDWWQVCEVQKITSGTRIDLKRRRFFYGNIGKNPEKRTFIINFHVKILEIEIKIDENREFRVSKNCVPTSVRDHAYF